PVVPSGSDDEYSAAPPNWCFHLSISVSSASLAFALLVSVLPLAMTRPASPLPVQSAAYVGKAASEMTATQKVAAVVARMGDRSRFLFLKAPHYSGPARSGPQRSRQRERTDHHKDRDRQHVTDEQMLQIPGWTKDEH